MDTTTNNQAVLSNKWQWTGRVIGAVAVLFMIFDGTIHVMNIAPVVEAFARLGVPDRHAFALGALELALVALYLVPRTAPLAAVLLTGYLGGAVAIHLRVGDPLWFPIMIGAFFWVSLALRDARVRTLARAMIASRGEERAPRDVRGALRSVG